MHNAEGAFKSGAGEGIGGLAAASPVSAKPRFQSSDFFPLSFGHG
jgi:hypothetical protein